VVEAVFTDGRTMGKAKRTEQDEAPSTTQEKKKWRDRRCPNPNTVVAADRVDKRQGSNNHFEQLLEKPCTNHGYPFKHKLKDCELLKRMLRQPSRRKGGDRDKEVPKEQGVTPKDENTFPNPNGYLMIFGCPEDDCTKHQHKVHLREVCAAKSSIPKFLRWSSTPITFDQGDHPPNVPRLGSYPLLVDHIVGNKRLTKVLMDGGSSLNILYVETFDAINILWSKLRVSIFPFLGIVQGLRAYPLENIELPITFNDRSNFRTETLIFEVIDFEGSYQTIQGGPCYAKFMAVPKYTYLKLKMPWPNGVIMVSGSFEQAYACSREHFELTTAIANSVKL
jgi:hypothetical protein